MKINKFLHLGCLILILIFCVLNFACNSSEQRINAQTTNQTANPSNEQKSNADSKIFDSITEPCRFFGKYDSEKPDYKQFYELQNAGYPKSVSLDEAVVFFNRLAQCSAIGKTQPPLRSDEVIGAIAAWSCAEETEAFQSKPYDKNTCQQFEEIVKSGNLPKGAWLEYDGGTCENCKGYVVEVWGIRLYLKLDKYRRDYKGNPIISRLIRLNYPSAKRNTD